MSREEYLEFITHQPYDAMGDFSFLLDEKTDKRLKGTFTRNGLLRLKCLILIKTVISIYWR